MGASIKGMALIQSDQVLILSQPDHLRGHDGNLGTAVTTESGRSRFRLL